MLETSYKSLELAQFPQFTVSKLLNPPGSTLHLWLSRFRTELYALGLFVNGCKWFNTIMYKALTRANKSQEGWQNSNIMVMHMRITHKGHILDTVNPQFSISTAIEIMNCDLVGRGFAFGEIWFNMTCIYFLTGMKWCRKWSYDGGIFLTVSLHAYLYLSLSTDKGIESSNWGFRGVFNISTVLILKCLKPKYCNWTLI